VTLPYYANGRIILGGEGDYILNFKVLQDNLNYAWQNVGAGFPATSLNFNYFNVFFFAFLQEMFPNIQIVNFILIFLIYFLPFFATLMVCRELQAGPFLSFLTAYFYVINPFSLYFLTSINQWNSLSLFIMPFFFWLTLKFYHHNGLLFLFFGLGSSLFAFTNANPPLIVINHMSIIVSLIFISLYHKSHFSLIELIKKYLVILSSFVLFNIWWILNWINVMPDIPKMYNKYWALSWAMLVHNNPNLIWKSFVLTSMIPVDPSENFLSNLYGSIPSLFVVMIPILILLYYFFYKNRFLNKVVCFLFSVMLVVIFLMKGPSEPFGFVYRFMILHIPFFSIFKSPIEKWGVLCIFLFVLLLVVILKDMRKNRIRKFLFGFFVFYLAFCSIPLITSNFIPDYKMNDGSRGSRKYVDKKEYEDLRQKINNDTRDYRLLSLPGSLNYQIALFMYDDKFYTGMDPVLSNINKQFIAPYSVSSLANFDILYDNISMENYSLLLSLYNIGKIVINKDMHPWFGFKEKENVQELEAIFDKTMKGEKNTVVSLYTNNNFLPRIYPAVTSILVNGSINEMFKAVTYDNFTIGNNALFLSDQTSKSQWEFLEKYSGAKSNYTPTITFQKMNPTRYEVKVENATSPFFLVFSESYHTEWKAYIEDKSFVSDDVIAYYENVNVKEVNHSMKFTPGDVLYLFKESVNDDEHFLANGYANAWYIDPKEIGEENFTIALYFRPQSYFYLGLFISGLTLIGCIGYLFWSWWKVKKQKAQIFNR
jgi:hypothetical protein